MKKNTNLSEVLGNMDIYLLDQVMKSRYAFGESILDAGCGSGRNLYWFVQNDFDISAIDRSTEAINMLKIQYPELKNDQLSVCPVEKMPFPTNHFDHIISSAVLHFAHNLLQFQNMLAEMVRVVKPGGSLFIRMTSDIGIEDKVVPLGEGVYQIPDGSTRFLLTKSLLNQCLQQYPLSLIEPLKTVNVDDKRCMSTLVMQKNNYPVFSYSFKSHIFI